MIGVGFFAISVGAVLAWAGYNDVDALATLDAILQKKPIPPFKSGEGLARIARAALVILALKTTAGALGGLLKGGVLPGGRGGGGGEGGGDVPGDIPGEIPGIPEVPVVPISTGPRIPPPTVTV